MANRPEGSERAACALPRRRQRLPVQFRSEKAVASRECPVALRQRLGANWQRNQPLAASGWRFGGGPPDLFGGGPPDLRNSPYGHQLNFYCRTEASLSFRQYRGGIGTC